MVEIASTCLIQKGLAESTVKGRLLALSGPSFAREIVQGQPTRMVLAGHDRAKVAHWCTQLSHPIQGLVPSSDVVGVELAGALKNIVAIAAGMATGLGYGDNARALLITLGLSDMAQLIQAQGGQAETLLGLAGIGDLVLTCMGPLSRNRSLG